MIALIVAVAKNRVIGNRGTIPWRIKGELKRFRELTTENVVIMGRRTFEDIGKPLPNRTNIVLSRTQTFTGCLTAKSLEEAISLAGDQDIYIAGGANIYKEALPLVERMYITEVNCEPEGDTYFPLFDDSQFVKKTEEIHGGEIPYTYTTYIRK